MSANSATSVAPAVENNLKPEDKPAANESNATPAAGGRRKRTSRELADALIISTPDGSSRRMTRSQVRGTPAPTPAKQLKPNLESKASAANGSPAKRRGRPPKEVTQQKPDSESEQKLTESVAEDESKTDNESEHEEVKNETVAPKVEKKQEVSKPVEVEPTETVSKALAAEETKAKDEEPKADEKPVEAKENSQPADKKPAVESNAEMPAEAGASEEAVNNHEA